MAPAPPRLLIANRGEIARRIIRGAHDAGWATVAVYAPDDASSPHVGEADVAVLLSGGTLAETYLNPSALIAAAKAAGAVALHPGYGFLSESPFLAEECAGAGLVWVGPTPEAMRIMGHKARAKETVAAAGVPVLPSVVLTADIPDAHMLQEADILGYPLLVKASAGGGGRGMRLVGGPDHLGDAVAAARREAGAAFGSDEVFLEQYLPSPRHVEVQVIGDAQGTVLHLFDRECSVQRRHQKVIEEAPAVLVDPETRSRMWTAAVLAARSVGYQGVGTVEYLVDGDSFYFLEMNTRLQVEHGVTELVTGLDLVDLQLWVASGRPLGFTQDEIVTSGHAVEARICAERPRDDFQPTPGTAVHVRWPEGTGIRVDRAIESGGTVSPAYDSLVAKAMAHGESRPMAIAKLGRALRSLELDGLETNREMLDAVLADEDFRQGEVGVNYLAERADLRNSVLSDAVRHRHAAAVAFSLLEVRAAQSLIPVPAAGWRNVGTALHRDHLIDPSGVLEVQVSRTDVPASVVQDGEWYEVGTAVTGGGVVDLTASGLRRRYRVRLSPHWAFVNGPEGQSTFALRSEDDPDEEDGAGGECRAPLPGAVTMVLVAVGDTVTGGDGLVVLEAMKMEHTLRAGGTGKVSQVLCAPGQQVDVGDLLVSIEPT
ncbi:MAG TPA: biotin carboxylase N-terminal domain-containing protein [Acidimicrobiales bacterium]|nr:biotin carboxylase N-terminal domain-containing protein [Acidimicrobiales bacterium]